MPGEHPEYSLGFAFSLLLCEILFVPEVGLHLFKIHSSNSSKGVTGNQRGQMHRGLFYSGGTNFSDILGAVSPVTSAMELAFVTLVLGLAAVLDAIAFYSAVETLVVSWGSVALSLPLLLHLIVTRVV